MSRGDVAVSASVGGVTRSGRMVGTGVADWVLVAVGPTNVCALTEGATTGNGETVIEGDGVNSRVAVA